MNYPRIFSLSTVGVIKHYIHDYLFHELRTDFIGPNGVGKSIIADLFQLLFIYDTDTIRFGTDGVKKEKRSIYTIPYHTKTAYCLLNIEVAAGAFLTIGIAIPEQKGRRIIPFVIARKADLNEKRESLTLDQSQLLFANDLTINDDIPDLTTLARTLLRDRDLYLVNFNNKEQVNDYYRFLYDKYILPLNLSTEKNFNAFAKVIQSFSKAKTLNLSTSNASRNLQEFLFEEADAELFANYQQQQGSLEKILREYKRLNEDIEDLKQKRVALMALWNLRQRFDATQKHYRRAQLDFAYKTLKELQILEKHGRESVSAAISEEKELTAKLDRLPRLESRLKVDQKKADQNYDLHTEYARLNQELEELQTQANELNMLQLPEPHEDWRNQVERIDIEHLDNTRIRDLVENAERYLTKYLTPIAIENKLEEQRQRLNDLEAGGRQEKERLLRLLKLFQDRSPGSLFYWFMNAPMSLAPEQRQLLLRFLDTPIEMPGDPTDKMRYVDPIALFEEIDTKQTSANGFWLKLGAIHEYIAANANAEIFADTSSWENSLQTFVTQLGRNNQQIDLQLAELRKLRERKPFNETILGCLIDPDLIEHAQFRDLKRAVACVLQFDEKLAALRGLEGRKSERLEEIRQQIPQSITAEEPAVVKKELEKIRDAAGKRLRDLAAYQAGKAAALKNVSAKLNIDRDNLFKVSQSAIAEQAELDQLLLAYHQDYDEQIKAFDPAVSDPSALKDESENIFEDYKNAYIGATHQFKEARAATNVAISLELSQGSYSFKALEQTLLGSKIKAHDEIEGALEDSNRNRLNMADNIRDSMIKVFEQTTGRYQQYKEQIQTINNFFRGRKISDRFYFKIEFTEHPIVRIALIDELISKIRWAARQGELQFDQPVDQVIEEFFKKQARLKERIPIEKLLNPKSYFELAVSLTDQTGNEIPGSTGETYSAIALLGIARLSVVQKEQRPGLRFIILEEIGSLDNTNFNTFPAIAKEFNYQIVTMAPHTFNIGLSGEWYAHHLIKGNQDENINFHPSASYFKSENSSTDLSIYLNRK